MKKIIKKEQAKKINKKDEDILGQIRRAMYPIVKKYNDKLSFIGFFAVNEDKEKISDIKYLEDIFSDTMKIGFGYKGVLKFMLETGEKELKKNKSKLVNW